jgi:hypothetical protein
MGFAGHLGLGTHLIKASLAATTHKNHAGAPRLSCDFSPDAPEAASIDNSFRAMLKASLVKRVKLAEQHFFYKQSQTHHYQSAGAA